MKKLQKLLLIIIPFLLILTAGAIIIFNLPGQNIVEVSAQALTCQQICDQRFQREGGCRTAERAEREGLLKKGLESLIQGPEYCPMEDESCYCMNNKPGVQSGFPVLALDIEYYEHLE